MLNASARIVAEEERHLAPRRRIDHGGVVAELRVRLEDRGAELGLEELENLLAHGSHRLAPDLHEATRSAAGSVARLARSPGVRSPRWILSWRRSSPSITASGRGGQPGT